MRFADPYALRTKTPRDTLCFAAAAFIGNKDVQEDYFMNFNDECFVLADGVGSIPHGEVAARLACETAIWAYKHIRQHRYYWLDKKLFMKRIFRSTNMTIWQKSRETQYREGMATTLNVLMVSPRTFWLGSAGDSSVWFVHNAEVNKLTGDQLPYEHVPHGILGEKRLGLVPDFITKEFKAGDTIVMASDGCASYITPTDLESATLALGETTEDLTAAAESLINAARINGSTENMTAVVIKRVAVS